MSMALPPDLASSLQGAAGGDPGAAAPPAPAPDEQGGGEASDLLSQALSLVRQATDAEPDPEVKHALEDISTKLQKIAADEQKLLDSATGTTPGAKLVRKLSGNSGAGAGAYGG